MIKVLLFSTDPGGANTIIPLVPVLEKKGYNVILVGQDIALQKYHDRGLRGINIFDRISEVTISELTKFIKQEKPDFIITSTSSDDNIDKYIWKASETLGIKSFAILDQWVNYRIRFSKYIIAEQEKFNIDNTIDYLPTKILVMDNYAKVEMLEEGFNDNQILVVGQPHFEYLMSKKRDVDEIKKAEFLNKINYLSGETLILFISENITKSCNEQDEGFHYWGYTERSICRNIIGAVLEAKEDRNLKHKKLKLLIKPHPKEDAGNFDDIVQEEKQKIDIRIIDNEDILLLLECVDIVLGMSSMFLIEASLLGKPIISVQIGLSRENPFVLDRMNLIKTVSSQSELHELIKEGLTIGNFNKHKINFKNMYKGTVDRIINCMEEELCKD